MVFVREVTVESEKLAGLKGPFKARSGLGYHLTVKTKEKVEEKIIQKFQRGTGTEMEQKNMRIHQTDGHVEELCLWCRRRGPLTTTAALAAVTLESPALALVATPTPTT